MIDFGILPYARRELLMICDEDDLMAGLSKKSNTLYLTWFGMVLLSKVWYGMVHNSGVK